MKQIGLGFHTFHDAKKKLPNAYSASTGLSWHVNILPYIEQEGRWERFDTNDVQPIISVSHTAPNRNNPNGLTIPPTYQCPTCPLKEQAFGAPNNTNGPSDLIPPNTGTAPAIPHYYGVNGPRGAMPTGGQYQVNSSTHEGVPVASTGMLQRDGDLGFSQVLDGTSNTLMVAEMSWVSNPYGTRYRTWVRGGEEYPATCIPSPPNCPQVINGRPTHVVSCRNVTNPINAIFRANLIVPYNDMPFGSMHPGGMNACLGDGSVRFIRETLSMTIYRSLASRKGGESVTID
jgi:prepilin-type processing-associated H-X9-DG protein